MAEVLEAIERVAGLAPKYRADLAMLRSIVSAGATLDEAAEVTVRQLRGGDRARDVIRLVQAELGQSVAAAATTRKGGYCDGDLKPPIEHRQRGALPEVRCADCGHFLVVPLGATGRTPKHVYLGQANGERG